MKIVREQNDVQVKNARQKFPPVPTREFITIHYSPNSSMFYVYSGVLRRRLYSGSTNGDKIVSSYFDGAHAVLVCQRRIYVYGPHRADQPDKAWRLISSFPAH